MTTVTWSAIACGYPGAGLYVGLAPVDEHLAVARGLGAKQARMFIGARMSGAEATLSVQYYAVRDPSAVRVIPVAAQRDHVHLRFMLVQNGDGESLRIHSPAAPLGPQSGFVVTIGLPTQEEAPFFEALLGSGPMRDWQDLLDRLRCGDGRRRVKVGRRAS